MSGPETYTCSACGGTFEKGWSDEEAAAEAKELWGEDFDFEEDGEVVCDDCHKKILAWLEGKKAP